MLVDRRSVAAAAALGGGAAVVLATVVVTLAGGSPGVPQADAAPPPRAARAPEPVTIVWGGDTVLGSRHGIPADEGRPVLAGVRSALRGADLALVNLEGTFGTGGTPKCGLGVENCFSFQAPPAHARTLRWAGVDAVNVANNHAYDYGPGGQAQTLAALARAGVGSTGRPGEITIVRRGGTRFALVGFAPYGWAADLRDVAGARALVAQAAGLADVVVVLMHAGAEGADQGHTPVGAETALGENRGDTRGFAHAAIDAGADLVLGSGPHVVRGLERYRGRLIAYSTGNLAGHHTFSTSGEMGVSGLLSVTVARSGRPLRGRWRSLRLVGAGAPTDDPAQTSGRLVAERSITDFGANAVRLRGDHTFGL